MFEASRGDSYSPSLSADGRYVAFVSRASDLLGAELPQCPAIAGKTQPCANVFVYDRETGVISLVSAGPDGSPGNGDSGRPRISGDGRWLVFASEATNLLPGEAPAEGGLFVAELCTGRLERLSETRGTASISGDGRYVAFSDNENVYFADRLRGETHLISQARGGGQTDGVSLGAEISADGLWVAFWSWAGNLVQEDVEVCRPGERRNYSCGDIFLYDRETGELTRIAVGMGYGIGMGNFGLSLSGDARWLSFDGSVYDRESGRIEPLLGAMPPASGLLSTDGRWVGFAVWPDIYLYDRMTGEARLASVASDGTPANGTVVDYVDALPLPGFFDPGLSISGDGWHVAFATTATNLAGGDTHECRGPILDPHRCFDVYVHDRQTGATEWISAPRFTGER